jgi:hypothetical protein
MSGSITNITFADTSVTLTSTIAVPTGISAGDTLALALMLASGTDTVVSYPPGFSPVTGSGATESSGPSTLFLATKTATGSESGSFTTTVTSTATRIISACCNVTGVGGGLDASNAADNYFSATSGPFNVASGTTSTTGTGRYALYIGMTLDGAITQTLSFNAPSGFTLAPGGTYDSGSGRGIMVAYAEVPSITTATYTGTMSSNLSTIRSAAGASLLLIETSSSSIPPGGGIFVIP